MEIALLVLLEDAADTRASCLWDFSIRVLSFFSLSWDPTVGFKKPIEESLSGAG